MPPLHRWILIKTNQQPPDQEKEELAKEKSSINLPLNNKHSTISNFLPSPPGFLVPYSNNQQIIFFYFQKAMSDQEGPSGGLPPPQGPTYQELINTVKTARKDLTRRERSRMDRELNKLMELGNESDRSHTSDTDASASSKTSDSETNSESSDRRKKKVKRRTEKRSKTGKLPKLLSRYEGAIKGLGSRVADAEDGEDEELITLINTLSKEGITRAIADERKINKQDNLTPLCPIATPPKLNERPATAKQYRDALQNLKDIVRSQVTGETADGIYDYLEATSRVAKSAKLNKDQFFDLIKSRIAPESTLYREVANCQRKRKSIKELYHILCVLFQGNMGYPQTLKKFNDYKGENLTASQFLSKLRTLANDLCYNIQDEKENETAVYEKVKDKVFTILPSLAPTILDKLAKAANQEDERSKMSIFCDIFMNHADKVTYLLSTKQSRRVNQIEEQQPNQRSFSDELQTEIEKQINSLGGGMKLTNTQLESLKNKCFKCANESIVQKDPHKARDCLLYAHDSLSMYMCSKCHKSVHLPRTCKSIHALPESRAAIEERLTQLGLPHSLIDEAINQKN